MKALWLLSALGAAVVPRTRGLSSMMIKKPEGTESVMIDRAKRYFSLGNKVKQQLGPTNAEDLRRELANDFEFVAPLVGPLGKDALIAATTGVDFAEGLPDFDARYHDFRIDSKDPNRVWCTMRVTGTHTGTFKFGAVNAEPKSPPVIVESPPEAVSLRFNDQGQVREITTGYPIDRRVGNTGGLGGIFGVLEGLGYPLPTPLTRSTGELIAPLLRAVGIAPPPDEELLRVPTPFKALPEDQLLQLVTQLLEANFGVENPELLGDSFTFSGPVIGPLKKDEFLRTFGTFSFKEAFSDLSYDYRDIRVCPYDTNRVWYTSSPSGTHTGTLKLGDKVYPPTGKRWVSPPECGSMQFDEEGKCVSVTGGYIMDRRLGNTNGLGGIFGVCAALEIPPPLPAFLLYTPTQNFARLQNGGRLPTK